MVAGTAGTAATGGGGVQPGARRGERITGVPWGAARTNLRRWMELEDQEADEPAEVDGARGPQCK